MAKSAKKSPVKKVKKITKKAAPKAAKKSLKKAAPKAVKKIAKKSVRKPVKKAAKKSAKKSTSKPVINKGKRFLVIYHAPVDAMAQTADITPEQQAEGMAMWKAWADRVGSRLADLGAPLINGIRVTGEGASTPSTREVAGYSLITAEDLAEVMDLLEGHPHFSGWNPDATIEVHETVLMPEM
jgi:hypothetical protein